MLTYHFGIKSTIRLIARFPGLIILPCFSPYAFSAEVHENKKVLVVSQKWTFVNLAIVILFATFGILAVFSNHHTAQTSNQSLLQRTPILLSMSLLFSSWITITLIFCSKNFCCSLTQRSGFVEEPDHSITKMDLDRNEDFNLYGSMNLVVQSL